MDTQTFKTTVRVFWDKANRAQPPKPQLLPGWKLHEEYLEMYKFQADETGIWAQHYDRRVWTKLDPITLEVVDDKAVRS